MTTEKEFMEIMKWRNIIKFRVGMKVRDKKTGKEGVITDGFISNFLTISMN